MALIDGAGLLRTLTVNEIGTSACLRTADRLMKTGTESGLDRGTAVWAWAGSAPNTENAVKITAAMTITLCATFVLPLFEPLLGFRGLVLSWRHSDLRSLAQSDPSKPR